MTALTAWELWFFEDLDEKDHWLTMGSHPVKQSDHIWRLSKSPWPPPPLFLGHLHRNFYAKKCLDKIFIMSKFMQKNASKVFGLGSTPPPWKMSKSKQKKCLMQFGFRVDPPPPFLDKVQIQADFFTGLVLFLN